MKTALVLSTAFITTHSQDEKALYREKQYLNGISDIYNRFQGSDDFEIFISDNTVSDEAMLSYRLRKSLEMIPKKNKYFKIDNKYGRVNKGCGLIAQWRYSLPMIEKKYRYIIHYEPRQILEDTVFFREYVKEPCALLREDCPLIMRYKIFPLRYRHFQTGLFSFRCVDLLQFANEQNVRAMSDRKISIERLLYSYARNNNISYKKIDCLGISWDSGKKYIRL